MSGTMSRGRHLARLRAHPTAVMVRAYQAHVTSTNRAWWVRQYGATAAPLEWLLTRLRLLTPRQVDYITTAALANGHAVRWCQSAGLLDGDKQPTELTAALRDVYREPAPSA
jgi:hypothetical protein